MTASGWGWPISRPNEDPSTVDVEIPDQADTMQLSITINNENDMFSSTDIDGVHTHAIPTETTSPEEQRFHAFVKTALATEPAGGDIECEYL